MHIRVSCRRFLCRAPTGAGSRRACKAMQTPEPPLRKVGTSPSAAVTSRGTPLSLWREAANGEVTDQLIKVPDLASGRRRGQVSGYFERSNFEK